MGKDLNGLSRVGWVRSPIDNLRKCMDSLLENSIPIHIRGLGCCNKGPQTGWIRTTKFIVSQFWKVED